MKLTIEGEEHEILAWIAMVGATYTSEIADKPEDGGGPDCDPADGDGDRSTDELVWPVAVVLEPNVDFVLVDGVYAGNPAYGAVAHYPFTQPLWVNRFGIGKLDRQSVRREGESERCVNCPHVKHLHRDDVPGWKCLGQYESRTESYCPCPGFVSAERLER